MLNVVSSGSVLANVTPVTSGASNSNRVGAAAGARHPPNASQAATSSAVEPIVT